MTFDSFFEASPRALRACAAFALNAALPILAELALILSCCCLHRPSSFFTAVSSGLSRKAASPTCTDGKTKSERRAGLAAVARRPYRNKVQHHEKNVHVAPSLLL